MFKGWGIQKVLNYGTNFIINTKIQIIHDYLIIKLSYDKLIKWKKWNFIILYGRSPLIVVLIHGHSMFRLVDRPLSFKQRANHWIYKVSSLILSVRPLILGFTNASFYFYSCPFQISTFKFSKASFIRFHPKKNTSRYMDQQENCATVFHYWYTW